MTTPFVYPPVPHVRRHGPMEYADYASYRPWLRDEFSFRCVYCLLREQWGRVRGIYDIDHLLPVVNHVGRALDYDNLLYACTTCNTAKGSREVPDPLLVLTSPNVQVAEDGLLHAATREAARLIKLLGLNGNVAIEFRLLWIGIVALAEKGDPDLYRRLMGFPTDLPDLQSLQPPAGNRRPNGIAASFDAQRKRAELPEIY
jgi:HNH endonuclease